MSSISKLSVNTELPAIKKDVPHTIVWKKSLPLNGAIWKGMRKDKENIAPLNNRISQKKAPQDFTFDKLDFANSIRHTNGLSKEDVKEREHLSLNILSQLLKTPVTPDGLVNFHLDRPLDTPIDANDPDISILYLVNWKKLKNDPQLDLPLDNPITRQELESHLQIPVTQRIVEECQKYQLTFAILEPYLRKTNPDVSTWQKHLNFFFQRSPNHKIALAELWTFLGYLPSTDETINFLKNRDLRTEITKEERYNYDWKTHINHLVRYTDPSRSLDQFVSFDEFRKLFEKGNWTHHLNCNRRKPLDHPITKEEAVNWKLGRSLVHPVSMAEKVNWRLSKDLLLGKGVGPKEHFQQLFGSWPSDWNCLGRYLGRQPSSTEILNWVLNRDLDHPVRQTEAINWSLGRPFDHPVSRIESANFVFKKELSLGAGLGPKEHYKLVFERAPSEEENPLAKYLQREPEEYERINWSLNRDLDSSISTQEKINWRLGRSLDHPISVAEQVNRRLGKHLALGQGLGPKGHYQLAFEKEVADTEKCLKEYLGRAPKHEESINWVLDRDLDHPVTAMDKRRCEGQFQIRNFFSGKNRPKSKPHELLDAIPE